ncbi:DUF5642 family protein [Mycobacterium sp.]|uniref:DUF5642 family protein n=1 Tax=Mycobacterium sp. TaxID=1785 RepID=UPI003A846854
MLKLVVVAATLFMLSGCSTGAGSAHGNIAGIVDLTSDFGPEFTVTEITPRAIDPQFFAARQLPEGLTFEPPDCAKTALGPEMPPGVEGNMAAISAEGNGNRFVAIAVETSKELPLHDPGKDCSRIGFSGAQLRGAVEVIDAPHIKAAHTQGVHRVMQALVAGGPRTGELYDYAAQFGDYQVIVIANPLVIPGQPLVKVDTQRARDLLVKAVDAVRD